MNAAYILENGHTNLKDFFQFQEYGSAYQSFSSMVIMSALAQ